MLPFPQPLVNTKSWLAINPGNYPIAASQKAGRPASAPGIVMVPASASIAGILHASGTPGQTLFRYMSISAFLNGAGLEESGAFRRFPLAGQYVGRRDLPGGESPHLQRIEVC